MREFRFQIDYAAAQDFDHNRIPDAFEHDSTDIGLKVTNCTIEPYTGEYVRSTHSVTLDIRCSNFDHSQIFGQTHLTAANLGIEVIGIPSSRMKFLDEE